MWPLDEVPTLRTDPILYLGLQASSAKLVGLFREDDSGP